MNDTVKMVGYRMDWTHTEFKDGLLGRRNRKGKTQSRSSAEG